MFSVEFADASSVGSNMRLVMVSVALVVIIVAAVAYLLPTLPQAPATRSTTVPLSNAPAHAWQSTFVNNSSPLDAFLTNITIKPNATFYTMPSNLSFQTFVSDPSKYQNNTCHGTYLMKSATQPVAGRNQSDLSAFDPGFPYVQSVAVYTRNTTATSGVTNDSDLCSPDYGPLIAPALMNSTYGTFMLGGSTVHTYFIPNMTAGELSSLGYYPTSGSGVYWYFSTVVYGNYEMQFSSIGSYAHRNMSSLSAEAEGLAKAFVSSASGSS